VLTSSRLFTPLDTSSYLSTPLGTISTTGIVNFIDARTQWIDDGMKRALDDGIKQVGLGVDE